MLYDMSGARVYPGKVVRRFEFNTAGASAVPSWLTQSLGSAAFTSSAASVGYYGMTSTPGAYAEIKGSFDIDANYFEELAFHVDGLWFSSDTSILVTIDVGGSNRGVSLRQENNSTFAFVRSRLSSNVDVSTKLKMKGSESGPQKKNVSLIWQPKLARTFVMMDDQIVADVAVPSASLGVIRPGLALRSEHASENRVAYFEQLRFEMVSH